MWFNTSDKDPLACRQNWICSWKWNLPWPSAIFAAIDLDERIIWSESLYFSSGGKDFDKLNNLQKQSSLNVVRVSFKEPLEQEWLQRLQGVKTVNKIDSYSWSLETDESELVRKQILEMSLQHNLNIVSLHSENKSLEEVFRSLTNGWLS